MALSGALCSMAVAVDYLISAVLPFWLYRSKAGLCYNSPLVELAQPFMAICKFRLRHRLHLV